MKLKNIYTSAIFTVFFLIAYAHVAVAQTEVEIDKKEFKIESQKEGYKEAWDFVKEGDDYYNEAIAMKQEDPKLAFIAALEFFLRAYKYNPDNAELNYKIGISYIKSTQKTKSLSYFEKAYKLKATVAPDIVLWMAKSAHLNSKFKEAIGYYQTYINSLSPYLATQMRKEIDSYIEGCKHAMELNKTPMRVFVENLGDKLNTKYPEFGAIVNADESMLTFVSRRESTTGGEVDLKDELFFEDIYISYKEFGKWTKPDPIGKPLNSDKHDATAGLSFDGFQLLIYKDNDIYVSKLNGTEWSSPKALPKTINSDSHEESACISPDGKTLYFTSNKPLEGRDLHDIYFSKLDKKGKWGEAVKIDILSSDYDDRGVYLHPDGKTMYFASKGHGSIGGFDIFRSTLNDNGTWTKPENLGVPINTPDDDIFFVVSGSGKHAYFSSVREEGYGEKDLYMLTFLSPEMYVMSNEDNLLLGNTEPIKETMIEASVEIITIRLTIVKGTITDAMTGEPIAAQIEIVDNSIDPLKGDPIIAIQESNSKTGRYMITLPSGKNYGIAVKAPDYLFHSENFNIPPATAYQEIIKDVKLLKVLKGSSIVLKNIFFETAKWDLRPESAAELDRLLGIMNQYPLMKIEISGHTDNTGDKNFNWTLSENRAKAVVDYLISKGIAANRMTYKGYADTVPIVKLWNKGIRLLYKIF